MVIIVICSFTKQKSSILKQTIELSDSVFFKEEYKHKFDSNYIKFSFKEHVYDCSVNYRTTNKSETSNIHQYSLVKNNIK